MSKPKEYSGIPGILLDNRIAKAIWNDQQVDVSPTTNNLQDLSGFPVYLCDDMDNCYGVLRFTDLSLPVYWIAQFNFPKRIKSKKQEGGILTDIVLDSSSVAISLKFIGTKGISKSAKNHELSTSLIVDAGGKRFLFNYGDDYTHKIEDINPDAIFLTNGHRHHTSGINDTSSAPIYAPADAIKGLNALPSNVIREIAASQTLSLFPIKITALDVIHSVNSSTYAYLIDIAHKRILFAPDIVSLKDKTYLREIDIFIGDATYLKQGGISKDSTEVYGHSPIETQMEWCRRYNIPVLILTNFGEQALSLSERKLEREINEIKKRKSPNTQVILAHDGMEYLGKSMSIEMIQYASQYNPAKVNNKVLLNDLKAVMSWYSTSKSTYRKIKFSEKEILSLMKSIYTEIYSRNLSGNMHYSISPSRMSPYAQEALAKLRSVSSKEIDYLITTSHSNVYDTEGESLDIVEELASYTPSPSVNTFKVITPTCNIDTSSQDSNYPPEGRAYRFGIQHHYRGGAKDDSNGLSALHSDFRMESHKGVGGFTWADQVAGKVPQVDSLKEAKEADKNPEASKINWDTGKFKEHTTKAGHKVRREIYAIPKQEHILPRAERTKLLLNLEGVYPSPEEDISTKYGPGIFTQLDNGQIEYGVKKPGEFEECWLNGKIFKGRLLHRKLPRGEYNKVGNDKVFWVAIQPVDQLPYILSEVAKDKKFITPYNVSAVPMSIRRDIPPDYRYWKVKDTLKRRQVRDGLIEAIKKKEVKIA